MEQWEIEYKKIEDEILRKVDNKEWLTEKEIKYLVYEDYIVEEIDSDKYRWVTYIDAIVEIQDRFFKIHYGQGNTEMQENEYPSQLVKEVKQVNKTIVVVEWEEVKNGED